MGGFLDAAGLQTLTHSLDPTRTDIHNQGNVGQDVFLGDLRFGPSFPTGEAQSSVDSFNTAFFSIRNVFSPSSLPFPLPVWKEERKGRQ